MRLGLFEALERARRNADIGDFSFRTHAEEPDLQEARTADYPAHEQTDPDDREGEEEAEHELRYGHRSRSEKSCEVCQFRYKENVEHIDVESPLAGIFEESGRSCIAGEVVRARTEQDQHGEESGEAVKNLLLNIGPEFFRIVVVVVVEEETTDEEENDDNRAEHVIVYNLLKLIRMAPGEEAYREELKIEDHLVP